MFELHQRVNPREVIVGWYVFVLHRVLLLEGMRLVQKSQSTQALSTSSTLVRLMDGNQFMFWWIPR